MVIGSFRVEVEFGVVDFVGHEAELEAEAKDDEGGEAIAQVIQRLVGSLLSKMTQCA
jgi:hypothetical protein